jgi:broad specificity phosphatase PhoE
MKEIYLIRHGQTNNSKKEITKGGDADTPLNKTGIEQSYYTGKYLSEYRSGDFDLVLCSTTLRAVQTSDIICEHIKYDKNDILYSDLLVEINEGIFDDNTSWKNKESNPKFKKYNIWLEKYKQIKDPIEQVNQDFFSYNNVKLWNKIYKRESYNTLHKRIKKVLDFIKNSEFKKILIISHTETIKRGFLKLLVNINDIKVDDSHGKECHISHIIYDSKSDKHILTRYPNTLHFKIYNKKY